jgi:hypothetical protein
MPFGDGNGDYNEAGAKVTDQLLGHAISNTVYSPRLSRRFTAQGRFLF